MIFVTMLFVVRLYPRSVKNRGMTQLHFVVNNSEISTLFVVEHTGTASSQNLSAIDLNESQSLKNKCNPAMQTKKIGEPAVTYWYNLSLNKLELFCFFSARFFLQNWSVEARCLQKERSCFDLYITC